MQYIKVSSMELWVVHFGRKKEKHFNGGILFYHECFSANYT